MVFTDSHCHLDLLSMSSPDSSIDEIIQRAYEKDVKNLLSVSVKLTDYDNLIKIADKYSNVKISVGHHPSESISHIYDVQDIAELAKNDKVVAIGETGLDYYRCSKENIPKQLEAFNNHIKAAVIVNKPLIIHSRDAFVDILAALKQCSLTNPGVMHCFTGSWEEAKQLLDLGLYISFSGIVTFKNAIEIQEAAKNVPLDKMLLETDAPYLAPVPYRGKTNEPAFLPYTANKIAEIKQISIEEVAEYTTNNYFKLFKVTR